MIKFNATSREELLLESIAYFDSSNRGYDPKTNTCKYYVKTTQNRCIIGMCCSLEDAIRLHKNNAKKIKYLGESNWNIIPEHVKDLGKKYLSFLQQLHDLNLFWDNKGINELGFKICLSIIEEFNLKINLDDLKFLIKKKRNNLI